MARLLLVVAVDGEPLVATGRQAAAQHAEALVRAARARAAGGRLVIVIGAGADEARAALAPLLAADELLMVPDVIGCADAALLPVADKLLHAAELLATGSTRFVTVAGAVVVPGARHVDASATVADAIAGAGGVSCGPSWVALASTLRVQPPLERDARVGDLPGLRAIIVAPGASTLARRARGDGRALDPASPLGVDRAWLGAFDPNAAAQSPLSLELVARRLGLDPGSLSWPALDPDLPLE